MLKKFINVTGLLALVLIAAVLIIGQAPFPSTRPIIRYFSQIQMWQHQDNSAIEIHGFDDLEDSITVIGYNADGDFEINTHRALIKEDIAGPEISDIHATMMAEAIYGQNANVAHAVILGWLTTPADAATETDLSPDVNPATFGTCTWTASDQIYDDYAYMLDLDGTDDYLTCADDAAWFMDDAGGANGCTIGFIFELTATTGVQTIAAQYDLTTGSEARAWRLFVDADEKINFWCYDESEGDVYEGIKQTTAETAGGIYVVHIVYDGAGGGSASAGMDMFVNGIAEGHDVSDNGSYTGMENQTTVLYIGAQEGTGGATELFLNGQLGFIFFTTDQFSADEVWDSYLVYKAYYNL